jgi:hypothetical protein
MIRQIGGERYTVSAIKNVIMSRQWSRVLIFQCVSAADFLTARRDDSVRLIGSARAV